MSSLTVLERYRKIISVAHEIENQCNIHSNNTPPPRPSNDNCWTSVTFIPPVDILQNLIDIGLSPRIAQQLSSRYMCKCLELKHTMEQKASSTIMQLSTLRASTPGTDSADKKAVKVFEHLYTKMISEWASQTYHVARTHASKRHTSELSTAQRKKLPFHAEYIPLLEKYFEYNAYPSAPDRAVLARKSMMTTRQIEVWFQNHRNRAKKDGKTLRRLTSDPLPLKLSLGSLEQQMPYFTVPEGERDDAAEYEASEQDSSDEDITSLNSDAPAFDDVLNAAAPPHAFPTTYPPSCDYDPFPMKSGPFNFPAPAWQRKPASHITQRLIDFDEFVATFATKLTLREGSKRNRTHRTPPCEKSMATISSSWFSATHTFPCSAPHPALIRPLNMSSLSTMPQLVPALTSSSCLPAFYSCPRLQPANLVIPAQNSTFERRKVAPLPKRTPQNPSVGRDRHSSTTQGTRTPVSSDSFSPSFNSDHSPLRRSWSSSSGSSTCSSSLGTPSFSPTQPSKHLNLPSKYCDFDLQGLEGLLSDTSPNSFIIGGLQSNLQPYHNIMGHSTDVDNGFSFGTPIHLVRAQS